MRPETQWKLAAAHAKTDKRDYDRLLRDQFGKVYAVIPIRNGKASAPREAK